MGGVGQGRRSETRQGEGEWGEIGRVFGAGSGREGQD